MRFKTTPLSAVHENMKTSTVAYKDKEGPTTVPREEGKRNCSLLFVFGNDDRGPESFGSDRNELKTTQLEKNN